MRCMFMMLVDAGTKWLDVVIMSSIISSATVDKLQHIFMTHGLPKIIVTDNSSSFTSDEFQRFCRMNRIQHITSVSYHPSTNGLVKRAMQSFKVSLRRMEGGLLLSKLKMYLFRYWITPNIMTVLSPAKMLISCQPRYQLDLVYPETYQGVKQQQQK